MQQSTFDKIRNRPRFKIYTDVTAEQYTEILNRKLAEKKEEFTGNINRETAEIYVKNGSEEYWTPKLSLRTEVEDDKTVIRGIFGPISSVWTFFMFLYFAFGILWMVFMTLWYVGKQIKTEDYSWGLWASFVTLGFVLLTYFAAQFGQKKAKPEMKKLRDFAIDSVRDIS